MDMKTIIKDSGDVLDITISDDGFDSNDYINIDCEKEDSHVEVSLDDLLCALQPFIEKRRLEREREEHSIKINK